MCFKKVEDWMIKAFGEDKLKWIKGIIAYFLIVVISNFVAPFTQFINNVGWQEIWVTYALIVLNAGVMVAIGFVVFFLGKPIVPAVTPDINTPPEEPIPPVVPEPVEPVAPVEPTPPEPTPEPPA